MDNSLTIDIAGLLIESATELTYVQIQVSISESSAMNSASSCGTNCLIAITLCKITFEPSVKRLSSVLPDNE